MEVQFAAVKKSACARVESSMPVQIVTSACARVESPIVQIATSNGDFLEHYITRIYTSLEIKRVSIYETDV
jgi:hypothetical protein